VLIDADRITAALEELGVAPDDTLLVHSGLQGSGRVAGARSRDKLDTIVGGLAGAVPNGTLLMPTFTYSFCRHEVFDRDASPSTVGLLTEHFRRLPGVRRTAEPIFSCAVLGRVEPAWEEPLFTVGDKDCFGPESVFAYLLSRAGRVLFYDVGFAFCTFVHHVEQLLGADYRYRQRFTGTVRDGAREQPAAVDYLVRKLDEEVLPHFEPLEAVLLAAGGARRTTIPGGPTLLVADCRAILEQAVPALAGNPDYLLRRGHAAVGAAA
jgi:aminoglycoside 3-N-acetyltransferase